MIISTGKCRCSVPVVFLVIENDRLIIVVRCHNCGTDVGFDLEDLCSPDSEEVRLDKMLANFRRKGGIN